MTKTQQALKYIRSIRNAAKRGYATLYAAFKNGELLCEPSRPAELSYMAAQAVRIHIDKIFA